MVKGTARFSSWKPSSWSSRVQPWLFRGLCLSVSRWNPIPILWCKDSKSSCNSLQAFDCWGEWCPELRTGTGNLQGAFVCNLWWCQPGSWLCPSYPEVNFKAFRRIELHHQENAWIQRWMCRTVQEPALLWWPILLTGNSWIHSPAKLLCHLPCKGRTRCSWLPCQTEGDLISSLQESHTIKRKRSLQLSERELLWTSCFLISR